ncbi:MAG: hypothetical protein E3J72_04155 [Planctomycetota bacterium]|nr:MAG: hypothetical protein E3J72_04155 [Planctomycetota bacterium]
MKKAHLFLAIVAAFVICSGCSTSRLGLKNKLVTEKAPVLIVSKDASVLVELKDLSDSYTGTASVADYAPVIAAFADGLKKAFPEVNFQTLDEMPADLAAHEGALVFTVWPVIIYHQGLDMKFSLYLRLKFQAGEIKGGTMAAIGSAGGEILAKVIGDSFLKKNQTDEDMIVAHPATVLIEALVKEVNTEVAALAADIKAAQ